MSDGYDAIVVGARCAGAPLARILAGAGRRVALVDASALPKDQPLSTHFILPFGMRILDELGLGDRVRAVAPPITLARFGIGDALVRLEFPIGGTCPRRIDLDAILLEGAREAGAEIRLRSRVVDVVREGGRVAGVVVEEEGARRTLRAPIVVGADGRHSTIAARVDAEEYLAYDGPRAFYWAYWPRPAGHARDPRFEGGTMIAARGDRLWIAFPAGKDQLLLGHGFPAGDEVAAWKADPEARLRARLAEHPRTAGLAVGPALGKVVGAVHLRYFFRRAAGPGWALVGDAGLFKDPTAGLGISDAFRDARALGAAILAGGDAALERYWRERDVQSVPLFFFARDLGGLDYDNPFNRLFYERLVATPALLPRMVDVFERRVSPYDAFTPGQVVRWTLGALLRGRRGVLAPFLRAGRVQAEVRKELLSRIQRAEAAAAAAR